MLNPLYSKRETDFFKGSWFNWKQDSENKRRKRGGNKKDVKSVNGV